MKFKIAKELHLMTRNVRKAVALGSPVCGAVARSPIAAQISRSQTELGAEKCFASRTANPPIPESAPPSPSWRKKNPANLNVQTKAMNLPGAEVATTTTAAAAAAKTKRKRKTE